MNRRRPTPQVLPTDVCTPPPWRVGPTHKITGITIWRTDGDDRNSNWARICRNVRSMADANQMMASPELRKELEHLVRLLEPLEKNGGMNVPGLATLNGAREALRLAKEGRS